ncbi:MAG: YceI family protein [Prolixibacteraceae bacterium]|nr:YceI family protein [Prolixibacteraceae bacterium]
MKTITGIFLAMLISSGIFAETLSVDTEKSELKWTGKKVAGKHYGKVQLKEGLLILKDGKIESGIFVVDMRTITSDDLPEGTLNEKLVGHLKSDDFFGVEQYPETTLNITSGTHKGNGNYTVNGKLTIRDITKPVEFEASREGNVFTATITVDRSEYNVKYGSGKFFQNLGDNLIYDDFTMDVTIVLE